MRLLAFAAATVLTGSLFAADPELVNLAMPDSQVMAGVNIGQVKLSQYGQYLLAHSDALPTTGLEKLTEATGFDPRRDLQEILVSLNGQPGGNSGIILARGTFDIPRILDASRADGGTIATYKGVSIVEDSKQGSLAFPDSTLAIAGSAADVRAAIDRRTARTLFSAALVIQVNQLSTTEDAWFVSTAPVSQLKGAGGSAPAPGPLAMLGNVQQASGGVKFGSNVAVNLQAVSQTAQDATTLAELLKSLPAMVQMGGADTGRAAIVALLQNLSVSTHGPVTKISLSVPESQIEQMSQTAHADQQAAIGVDPRALAQTPGRAAAPPPPSGETPQRIRVGSNVQKAKLIQQVPPVYPPLAKEARITGVVRLNAVIAKDGTVKSLTLVSGHPLLVPAAFEAAKQWVYQPTLLNGQPVEVVTQVDVNFALEQ